LYFTDFVFQEVRSYAWEGGRVTMKEVDGLAPLGEADVKFTRYADLYEKLWVDSIDGDSVPIALMHHERALGMGVCPPRVAVYRLEIKLDKPEKAGAKRERPKRTWEYMSVTGVYEALKTAVLQSVGRTHLPLHSGHEIRMLISLIALTGTDFSRGLPRMSGRGLFESLSRVWMTLAMVYDPSADQLRVGECVDRLVALLYHLKFPKHASDFRGLGVVLAQIRASGLSPKIKEALPSPERVETTVRNANWVLQYWRCEPAPDPVENGAQFGYREERGVPRYADAQ
jgi:hypothetical protein